MNTTVEPFVDGHAVAEFLGVSYKFLERHAEAKGLPRRKIGGRWRYRLSEVSAWVDAGMEPTPEAADDPGPAPGLTLSVGRGTRA